MEKIANLLITWFQYKKRELPWRKNRSPYRVWVSEIILQQTKVEQGKAYFERFMAQFPNIKSLATADQKDVLKVWEGLGYYSRARNLHKAANQIIDHHNGVFPNSHEKIIALKGVGKYTAGAILSFAWNRPYPAIDGNTVRVTTRVFGIHMDAHHAYVQRHIASLITELYKYSSPKEINESIIELGALICRPKNPLCTECPINNHCVAKEQNTIHLLPLLKKKAQPRERVLHFILLHGPKDTIYIELRQKSDIWKGLYTPLLIEGIELSASAEELLSETAKRNIKIDNLTKTNTLIHKLTHQTLHINIWQATTKERTSYFIKRSDLSNFPTPKPFISIFKKISE
ncbi:A/G-specific adenine glycosylase [Prolixibacteraceae bacterium]|nr:A/G-specific adenine glycosylase [Prolixibacteraceae bacterium]